MSIKPWEIQSEEIIFSKYGRQVVKRVYKLPNSSIADYYIKKEKNTAGVFALTKDKKVLLVKQYRPGPDKVMLDLPGGFIDEDGSDPKLTAERELLEETGYKGKLEFLVTSIDDAYSTVKRSLYVATQCEKVSQQKLEDTEFAEVCQLTLPEFRQLLRSGQMTDIEAGYLALDHLDLL